MPVPQPGGHWATTAAVLGSMGLDKDSQICAFATMTRTTDGACGHDKVPITITCPDDEKRSDLLHYLPAPGLSCLARGTYYGQTDSYSNTAIEALP